MLLSTQSTVNNDLGISSENRQGVCVITINRPKKMNAFTIDMYEALGRELRSTAANEAITMAMITGAGNYFTAGNDLSNWESIHKGSVKDSQQLINKSNDIIEDMINAFIEFPKPLIGAVNGPAIGIGTTILALMDSVVASDRAYFYTPFTALGISAEACSSYTFPRLLGGSLAADMLMFNRKLTAPEALNCGLISQVIPETEFKQWVDNWVFDDKNGLINTCYRQSLQYTKQLLRNESQIRTLRAVNSTEFKRLRERLVSDECRQALHKFFSRKK